MVLEKSDAVGASWRAPLRPAPPAHHPPAVRACPGLPMPRSLRTLGLPRRRGALPGEVRRVPRAGDRHRRRGVPDRAHRRRHRLDAARHRRARADRPRGRRRHRLQPHPAPARLAGPRRVHRRAAARRDYRNPEPYAGQDVLVVGVGNTGAEIAVDLVEGGAARVRLAVRTAPHIVRRSTAGWPAQRTGHPRAPAARAARGPARRARWPRSRVPDLSAHGLPAPGHRPVLAGSSEGAIPVQDVGLIDAVRSGRVETGGRRRRPSRAARWSSRTAPAITPDAVIAATGYRRAPGGPGRPPRRTRRARPARVRTAPALPRAGPGPVLHRLHQPHQRDAPRDGDRRGEDRRRWRRR